MKYSFYLLFAVLLFGCFHSESDDASPNPNPEPTPCELDPQSSPSCEGYVPPVVNPCTLDPQSSPSCPSYVAPDPCELNPQSDPMCPGYVKPVDPCDADPQSSPSCTGYVEPCVLDPLSSESCPNYEVNLRRERSSQWVKHFVPGLEKISKSLFDSKQETVRYRMFENIRDESVPFNEVPEDERIPHYKNFGFHETQMRCFASSLLMVVRDEITCLGRGIGDDSGGNSYFKVFDGTKEGGLASLHGLGENSMEGSYRAYKRVLAEADADSVSKDAYVISLALEFGEISLIASKDVDFENGPALAHSTENNYLAFEDAFDNFIARGEDQMCETEAEEEYNCREQAIENLRNHPDKIILATSPTTNSGFQCSDSSQPDLGKEEPLSLIQAVCVRIPSSISSGSIGGDVYLYFRNNSDIVQGSSSGTSYSATAIGVLAYMVSRTLGLQTGAQAFSVIKSCAVPDEEDLPGELGDVDIECLFQDDGSLKTCDDSSLGLNVDSSCMDIAETVSVVGSMVLPGDISKLEMTDRYGRNFPVRVKLGGIDFRHDFERPWLVGKDVFSLPLTFGISGGERVLVNSFSFQNDWLSVSHFSGIEDNFFGFRTNSFVRQIGYVIDSFYRGLKVSFLEDFRSAKYRGSEIEGRSNSFSLSFESNLSSTTFLSFEAKFSLFKEGKLHLGDSSYKIQKGAKDSSLKMSFSFGF